MSDKPQAAAPSSPKLPTSLSPKWRRAFLLCVVLAAAGSGMYGLRGSPPINQDASGSSELDTPLAPTSLSGSPSLPENLWLEQIQSALKAQSARLDALTQALENLKNTQPLIDRAASLQDTAPPAPRVSTTPTPESSDLLPVAPEASLPSGMEVSTWELPPRFTLPTKNPLSFVPAGTFVQAVMLGAADAPAGVTNQANPSPMLFRLTSQGTLPSGAHSRLKDCVLTAAVIGDISSERGQVRLERLSCVFPGGAIVEQPVEGTVFALDAKNGVRGRPVWREGALLARATLAGAFSGLASSLTSLLGGVPGKTLPAAGLGENLLKTTGAQGASAALEKLAQYHIERAEHYHPVIQLSAGQTVDVVFLKGFYLDGRKVEESTVSTGEGDLFSSETGEENRLGEEGGEQEPGLTLTSAQIEKIKARTAVLNPKGDRL